MHPPGDDLANLDPFYPGEAPRGELDEGSLAYEPTDH
jgi:hypothetical protein